MVTFESIKERNERLTNAQKELLLDVSAHVHSDDLDKYIERVKSYVDAIKSYNDNADNDAVISYLEYARNYDFPDVYYLKDSDDEYDDRKISIDDFYSVSLFNYIDSYAVENLKRDFIDYVLDPVHNSAPDLTQFNDQYFKDEAEAFIKDHNESLGE